MKIVLIILGGFTLFVIAQNLKHTFLISPSERKARRIAKRIKMATPVKTYKMMANCGRCETVHLIDVSCETGRLHDPHRIWKCSYCGAGWYWSSYTESMSNVLYGYRKP